MDRRAHTRRRVWLPAQVDQLREGMAVTHDASPAGVLMVAASKLEVGSTVTMVFQIPPGSETERRVQGTVIRVEANAADPLGMWPYRIAVEFSELAPELLPVIEELALQHDPD